MKDNGDEEEDNGEDEEGVASAFQTSLATAIERKTKPRRRIRRLIEDDDDDGDAIVWSASRWLVL